MTTTQLFFAILIAFVSVNGLLIGIVLKYIDTKVDTGLLGLRIEMKAGFDLIDLRLQLHEAKHHQ